MGVAMCEQGSWSRGSHCQPVPSSVASGGSDLFRDVIALQQRRDQLRPAGIVLAVGAETDRS